MVHVEVLVVDQPFGDVEQAPAKQEQSDVERPVRRKQRLSFLLEGVVDLLAAIRLGARSDGCCVRARGEAH